MFYKYLWFFFIYAFLGWCCEVCFAAAKNGHFVNRGFLNGPWCPIYGCGVCIVVFCLTPLKESVLLLFLGSVILTSALELVTGFLLEKLFHQKWWDYSDMPFNIGGYICLLFSLVWGMACLLIMNTFHPMIAKLISVMPHTLGVILLCLLGTVMLVDLSATISTVLKLNQKLRRLEELAERIKSASDDIGSALSGRTLSLAEKGAEGREAFEEKKVQLAEKMATHEQEEAERKTAREKALQRRNAALTELKEANDELLATYHFGQRRLLRAFPSMKSTRHSEALEQMKQKFKNLKK